MYAVKISVSGTAERIDFPSHKESDKQYRIMSDAVGGYIERVPIIVQGREFDMWVNEEGLLQRLPYNSLATSFYEDTWNTVGLIVGDVIITKSNGDGDTLPLLAVDAVEIMAGVAKYAMAGDSDE